MRAQRKGRTMNMNSEENGAAELSSADLERIAGGGAKRPTGMTCPECYGFIPVSMQQIITESAIFCPHCGYRLNLSHQDSQPAVWDAIPDEKKKSG